MDPADYLRYIYKIIAVLGQKQVRLFVHDICMVKKKRKKERKKDKQPKVKQITKNSRSYTGSDSRLKTKAHFNMKECM